MRISELLERLAWMLKTRNCRRVCVWCEYYDICKASETAAEELKGGKEQ